MALPPNLATNDVISEAWVDAVVDTITPTAWTAVTFQGAWVNFGAPYQVAQYRKIGDVVQMRGVIKSGALNTAAMTLPVGFRPPATQQFATVSGGQPGYITVDVNGVVNPAVGLSTSFDLSPCTFSTVA